MEQEILNKEVSKALRQFFEKNFPLEKRKFKNLNEFINYYIDIEKQLNNQLDALIDKIKPVPYHKIKIAHNTLLENLIISFESNSYSKDVNKAIQKKYKEIIEQITKDSKIIKNKKNINNYILDKTSEYISTFYGATFQNLNIIDFPNFLTSKFILLIKNKFLTLLSEKNIDVDYFLFSDDLLKLTDIYQDIFIYKTKFLFNAKNKKECTQDYFKLILLSNNFNFKNTKMKYLDNLIRQFKYFVYIFNLDNLYENKEFDEEYNMNILAAKLKKEYIDISPEEAEKKKNEILKKIIRNNSDNRELLLNIVLSYTLVLNFLIVKNKVTGDVEVSITDNYSSFASMIVLLNNTLNSFDLNINTEEIRDFTQSLLIKDIFSSQNYNENKSYDIEKIKNILINNPKNNKLKNITINFFKELNTTQYNGILEFFFSLDQQFKDQNISEINLTPMNPKITSTHCYIFVSGYLSQNWEHYEEWENMALNLTSNNVCYFYHWPGDSVKNMICEAATLIGMNVANNKNKNINKEDINKEEINKEEINKEEINKEEKENKIQNTEKNTSFSPAKSFFDSSRKASLCGKILAFILASKLFFKYQTVTLIGFSLGTHVIRHCIKKMYELHCKENIQCNDIIENVVLIAGATSIKNKEEKYKEIFSQMINGKLINCYSKKDDVLSFLYTDFMKKKPIGNSELEIKGYENLKNIDFTALGLGHTDYRKKMDLVKNRIDLYI